jgi:hypothetical protein
MTTDFAGLRPGPGDDWQGMMPTPPMPSTTEQLEQVARTYFLHRYSVEHAGDGDFQEVVRPAALTAWDELSAHEKWKLKNALLDLVVTATTYAHKHLREHMKALLEEYGRSVTPPYDCTEDALAALIRQADADQVNDPDNDLDVGLLAARRIMNLFRIPQ